MESTSPHTDAVAPAKATEPRRLRCWARNALLATLPLLGGDSAPAQESLEHPDMSTRAILAQQEWKIPGAFLEEQERNPSMTEESYLDLLAKTLTTPKRLDQFLKTRMRYAWDSPDPDNPLQEGTADHHGSYWQTPFETIRRIEKGKMLGDCEDYALLTQEILRRQGKSAHVVLLLKEKHAMCAWVEKDDGGKYQGRRADENGVMCGAKRETIAEALKDATLHCPLHPYGIPVCHGVGSFWYVDVVSIHAFDPDLPCIARISGLELAALTALLGGAYGTYRHLRRRREGTRETWKEYFATFRLH